MNLHSQIDQRGLAFGRAIAARLATEPELIDRAKSTAQRWLTVCSAATQPALREWLQTLDGPVEEVITLLTSADERATRLRQSNPFAGVLSQQQRLAIVRQFYDPATA